MAHQQPAPRSLEQRIEALSGNRTSGAMDLALEVLDLARHWLAEGRPAAELAARLRSMHPAIAAVSNVGRLLEGPASDLPSRLAEVRASLVEGNRRIAHNLEAVIPAGSSIITLSNSSTVREALFALKPDRVYVMRSLPGGEGEAQAESLRKGFADRSASARVEVIPDSTIANVVPLVDCALVGVDSYDAAGAILHKVGTLPLALCCRHFGKPFYAAGHSLKHVTGELLGSPATAAGAADPLFDCTPGTLIAQIVSEEAVA